MPSDGDERLIRRASEGDLEAAGEVARRCERRLRVQIHRRLGPRLRRRVDTEDLLQSTLTAVLRGLPGLDYRGEEAFGAWLSTVAERQILQKARFHRAGCRDVRREEPIERVAGVAHDETSPSEGVARRERCTTLREAISRLPERERSVLELHSIRGLTFEAVARELGLSDRSSAYRVFERALSMVGEIMGEEG